MNELEKLRKEIDEYDVELTKVFEKRMETVLKVAKYKKENDIQVLNTSREKEVIEKNISYLKNPDFKDAIRKYFESIMKISKDIQKKQISIQER